MSPLKEYLLTPGPTPVPPRVLAAMGEPMVHHRTPRFQSLFAEVREGLRWVFRTEGEVLTFAATGTAAMEAAVANLASPGERALVVEGGKFGERWREIAESYGLEVTRVEVPWGESADPGEVLRRLDREGPFRLVLVQACETSTGVKHDVEALGRAIRDRGETALVVDAVSALGVYPIETDAWGLDAVVAGSQKGLMLPPGLSFISLSPKAWRLCEKARSPRYYLDLRRERPAQADNDTAYTPALSLLRGLRAALEMMKEEGLEAIFARHARLAAATRAGVGALRLKPLGRGAPSEGLTVARVPDGVDGKEIPRRMERRCGVTIAGGQGALTGKIFRIAHMGYVGPYDVLAGLAALEEVLGGLGYPAEPGAAVGAARRELVEDGR